MSRQQGVTSQQIFDMLMESQHWLPDQMLAYQRSQLEQLLRHAKKNVPFYESRLDCVFRRDGSIDWDRWEEIPIVTREDLRDRRAEMQAKVLPPGHGMTKSYFTSGSTGVPIEFTTSSLADVARKAGLRRMLSLYRVPTSIRSAHISTGLPDYTPLNRKPVWYPNVDKNYSGSTLYVPQKLSAPSKLAAFREHDIEYYYDFASNVVELARANLTAIPRTSLRFVCTYGMGLLDEEVSCIRDSFGCKVISLYSSKECGLIAHSKPRSRHYLLCPELVLIEGLEYRNSGQEIPVVATPLFNAAQPLIRYAHGDIIVPGRIGANGKRLQISEISGRSDTYFLFGSKKVPVVGIQDWRLVRKLKALAVQVAQTSDDTLEVRYVAATSAPDIARQNIARHLKSVFPDAKTVRVRRMVNIPRNAGGKLNRYVRELNCSSVVKAQINEEPKLQSGLP